MKSISLNSDWQQTGERYEFVIPHNKARHTVVLHGTGCSDTRRKNTAGDLQLFRSAIEI